MSPFASSITKVFYGTLIHSISIKEVEYISNGLLFVDAHGRIAKIVRNVKDKLLDSLNGVDESKVLSLFLHRP
jgi:guanine deaminase